jgi:AGZA family xanthine/uracil permease-like MFS transporter
MLADSSYTGIHSFIGLSSGGLGVIGGDTVNFVGLGGCKAEDYITDLSGYCARRVLQNPTMWLGIFLGGYAWDNLSAFLFKCLPVDTHRILTVLLMLYRIKGAILIGIFITSIVSWPRPTAVTYFPHTPAGDDLFAFFEKVVTFHPLTHIGNAIDVSDFGSN